MMKVLSLILILILSSCSLFENENSLGCKNLVMTGAESPEVFEIIGDPSGQWSITGIANPEEVESNCEEGTECDVGIPEYHVSAAYPNPVRQGSSTTLSFSLPETTQVKVTTKKLNGSFNEVNLDRILSSGSYSVIQNFDQSSSGCYKVEYFLNESEKPNAYGLVLVE